MFCQVLTDAVAQERTSLAEILGADDGGKSAMSYLERAFVAAREVAADPGATDDERIRFVGLLGRQGVQDIPILTKLLVPQSPVDLQLAVVAALVRIDAPIAADALLAEWPGYGPTVRAAVLEGVLSRGHGAGLVLDQLESGRMPAAQFDALKRQQLLTHPDDGVRLRAATLFNSEAGSDRRQVVASHADVAALAGDPLRGRKVFVARCATCHKLGDEGHVVGPDLAALTDKSPTALLVAILDPNRAVDARYVSYSAITTEGTAHTGILAAETSNTITLLSPDGKEQVLFRSQVDELESGGKSLMPEGVERDLSKQDLADLIAMLRGGAPARRQFAGNEPREVAPESDGALVLPAAAAEIYGTLIVFESPVQNIGYWHNQEELAAWTIALDEPGTYKVLIDYACHDDSAGNRFVFEGGEGALTGTVPATGGWDRYQGLEIGTLSLPSGRSRLIVRPAAPVKGALFDLRTIRLEPHK